MLADPKVCMDKMLLPPRRGSPAFLLAGAAGEKQPYAATRVSDVRKRKNLYATHRHVTQRKTNRAAQRYRILCAPRAAG